MTRDLHPCESTRTTHQGTHSETLCNSTPSIGVFALDQNRRDSLKKSRGGRVGSQYIHRCLVRRRRVTITDGSDDNSGEPADRIVQSETGGSLPIDYRSRIYSGLRRSEGCGLDPAIPERIRNNDQPYTPHRQRGGIQSQQEIEVCPPQSSYRTSVPLSPTANPNREAMHQNNTWEGQSCRYSDEALANELSAWLEGTMDVDHLTPILDMTEDELIAAGINTWALE